MFLVGFDGQVITAHLQVEQLTLETLLKTSRVCFEVQDSINSIKLIRRIFDHHYTWNPNDLYFLKVNPWKQGLFQAKEGSFGFQAINDMVQGRFEWENVWFWAVWFRVDFKGSPSDKDLSWKIRSHTPAKDATAKHQGLLSILVGWWGSLECCAMYSNPYLSGYWTRRSTRLWNNICGMCYIYLLQMHVGANVFISST